MLTAFSTALSGLDAESTAISVVGNNLANLNTNGFKASTVVFSDLLSQTIDAGETTQVGMGVQQPVTQTSFSQGSTTATTDTLDAAISGQGFFVIKAAGGQTEYTRDGDLTTDAQGNLITATGEYLQGWNAVNGTTTASGPISNIAVPTGTLQPATATSNMSLSMNLDSTAANTTPATGGVANTPTYSTSIQVYDSLGQAHTLTLDFWKTSTASSSTNSVWDWSASVPSSDGTTSSTGTLNFDQSGNLVTSATSTTPVSTTNPDPQAISITGLTDGAQDMSIKWSLLNGTTPAVTQYAQTSSVSTNAQDGNAAAQVGAVSIGSGGTVMASLSDGQTVQVGQLALASFVNPGSLTNVGNNAYQVSGNTSNPSVGTANTGARGNVIGSSLEASTVDISTEFTNLMTYQNSYEADSRVVTTANTIEQQAVSMISPGA